MNRNDVPPIARLDPLLALQRRTRRASAVCAGVVLLAAMYALWPVTIEPVSVPTPLSSDSESLAAGEASGPVPLDLAAFETPLWLAPPPPPPTEIAAKPPPPPPPLKLELLGILREGESYRAVVYDPETDKVTVLSSGDTLAGRTVGRITAETVAIKDGAGTRTLTLKTEAKPGAGGGSGGGGDG